MGKYTNNRIFDNILKREKILSTLCEINLLRFNVLSYYSMTNFMMNTISLFRFHQRAVLKIVRDEHFVEG